MHHVFIKIRLAPNYSAFLHANMISHLIARCNFFDSWILWFELLITHVARGQRYKMKFHYMKFHRIFRGCVCNPQQISENSTRNFEIRLMKFFVQNFKIEFSLFLCVSGLLHLLQKFQKISWNFIVKFHSIKFHEILHLWAQPTGMIDFLSRNLLALFSSYVGGQSFYRRISII